MISVSLQAGYGIPIRRHFFNDSFSSYKSCNEFQTGKRLNFFPMVRTSAEVCACTDNLEPNPGSKL